MIKKVLITQDEIDKRLDKLAEEINEFYKGEPIIVIPLLRGGFMFAADLIKRLDMLVEVDFITTASYGHKKVSSGDVKVFSDLRSNVTGKNVLIVDDIIDSGNTLKFIKDYIGIRNPKSLKIATMLDKPSRRTQDVNSDFVGFEVDDVFIVGYGLDYENNYRNVPYIFEFLEEGEDE